MNIVRIQTYLGMIDELDKKIENLIQEKREVTKELDEDLRDGNINFGILTFQDFHKIHERVSRLVKRRNKS